MTIYPKFEKEGLEGMSMKQMTIDYREETTGNDYKLILRGEAIGKSLTDLTKVYLYQGYAHGTGKTKPMDAIIASVQGNYRAVPQFEDFKWECSMSKTKKVCADPKKGVNDGQLICGDYFFGRTDNYHKCPLMEVNGPIVYTSFCGTDNEVLSSYHQKYKLSLWCNGYLSEVLNMPEGLTTISTMCEVRSEDGRTTYTHQVGSLAVKGATTTRLGSSTKTELMKIVEDKLGWPVTGTLIGLMTVFSIVFTFCTVRICRSDWFKKVCCNIRSRTTDVEREIVLQELTRRQPLLSPGPVSIVNNFRDKTR